MGMVVLGPELLKTLGTLQKRFARLPRAGRPGAPEAESWPSRPGARHGRRRGRCHPAGRGPPRPGPGLRRERVPLAVRAPGLSKYHDDHPLWVDLAGMHVSVDYEPGRVAHRHVRRQLQLAGAGLDAGQLPGAAQPAALRPIARGDGGDRVPDGKRPVRSRWPLCADDLRGAADLAVPPGNRRPPTVQRLGRRSCRTTRDGATTSRSASTSTATTAPGSVPATRRAGPGWSPT